MMPLPERAIELLCDSALFGLDEAERHELNQLLASAGHDDLWTFDVAAAAIDLAAGYHGRDALPENVQRSAIEAARVPIARAPSPTAVLLDPPVTDNVVALQSRAVSTTAAAPPQRSPWPWLMAAACFAFAIGSMIWSTQRPQPVALTTFGGAPDVPVPEPTPAQQREQLIAAGAKVMTWSATSDPAAAGARGDVVWDQSTQRGFMRFSGLAANNPQQSQYQLWIFDDKRDQRFPIDGGVFDIDRDTGDVIVAIRAKLPVDAPTLFAVTVERPGGVVVSNRQRIVVTAKT